MMGKMMGMDSDVEAKLQVLQEIKDLMDSRLGDKMKGMSVEKVSLLGDEGDEESSQEDAMEGPMHEQKEEMMGGLGSDEMDKLKALRSKLIG